jgi:palmitoyltransferase ZDHHC6
MIFQREQLMQKREKRQRARKYEAIHRYSGAWLPISHGFKTFFCPPFSDELRLRLHPGEILTVTRWKTHWLFGELQLNPVEAEQFKAKWKLRGWFPRNAVVDLVDATDNDTSEDDAAAAEPKKSK